MTYLEIFHADLKSFSVDNLIYNNPNPGFAIHKSLVLALFGKSLIKARLYDAENKLPTGIYDFSLLSSRKCINCMATPLK